MTTMKWRSTGIIFAAVLIIGGCSTMPMRPDTLPRGDYSYVKEYISWLAKKEMKKNDVVGLCIALKAPPSPA